MHEFSLCESILDSIAEQARRHGFQRVRRVVLDIGELANVELEALRFAFEITRCDTLAATAELTIIEQPGRAECPDCARSGAVHTHFDPCPHCGGHRWRLTGGHELRIRELEVE